MNVALEDASRVTCYTKKDELLQPLCSLLCDRHMRVRAVACQALAMLLDKRAIPALSKAASDESTVVRVQAVMALGEMDSSEAIQALMAALADEDSRVRIEA